MEQGESNGKRLAGIMRKSMLGMPFSDFDEKVMGRIRDREAFKRSISKDLMISGIFFLLGTGFGLFINYYLSHANSHIFGLPPERGILLFQLGFVLIFLSQLERIIKLVVKTRKY